MQKKYLVLGGGEVTKKSQGVPEKGEKNYKEKYKESENSRTERKTVIKKVTVKRKEVESSKEIKAADSNKIEGKISPENF